MGGLGGLEADAEPDQSLSDSDAAEGEPDRSIPDSGTADAGTSVFDSGSGDTAASADTGVTDSGVDASAVTDGQTRSETGAVDAGMADAGPLDGAGPDGSGAVDAGAEAEAGCTTTIGDLSEAGTSTLLFNGFDNVASAAGWSITLPAAVDGGAGVTSPSPAVGHTCPGSILLLTRLPYPSSPPGSAYYGYQYGTGASAQDWSSFTKLHMWIRFSAADFAALQGIEPFMDTNGFADLRLCALIGPNTTLSDGGKLSDGHFHEIVIPLAVSTPSCTEIFSTFTPTAINAFGVLLVSTNGLPPGQFDIYVDDVWLE